MNEPIFVFGSNLAGIHGAGAAAYAHKHKGALWGKGVGHHGNSYALPTKGFNIETLSLAEIDTQICLFLRYAKQNPLLDFHLTPVGCGLAGHKRKNIWGILKKYGVPSNVYFTSTWLDDHEENQ